MSDFLSNLVAKSLNLTEAVQPRLTSMFEPQQDAGEALKFEPQHGEREGLYLYEEAEADARPQAREGRHRADAADYARTQGEDSPYSDSQNQTAAPTADSRARNALSRNREAASPFPSPQMPTPESLRPQTPSSAFYPVAPPPISLEPIRPVSEDLTPMDSSAVTERDFERHSPQQERVVESIESRKRVIESVEQTVILERRTMLDGPSPILAQPPTPSRSGEPRERATEPVVERMIVERTLSSVEPRERATPHLEATIAPVQPKPTPGSIIAQPKIAPYIEPQTVVASARAPVKPETTIQVTIGRVEVRATTAPPAQERKYGAATPQIMGLDAYLRRRSNGGGR